MDHDRFNSDVVQSLDGKELLYPLHAFGTLEDIKMLWLQGRNQVPTVWAWPSSNNAQ